MIQHPTITYLYQFLAEAIIAFMLILPFTFGYYYTSHYFGFVLTIFVAGFCFFLLETYKMFIGTFFICIPISFGLLYLFQFPIGLVIVFPLVFVWRYVTIRSYTRREQSGLYLHMLDAKYAKGNREKIYLHMTLILSVIVVIYSKEIYVVLYLFLQLLILFIGFLLSHIAVIEQAERKHVNVNKLLFVPILMLVGSVISFKYFDFFRQISNYVWVGLRSSIVFVASFVAQIIRLIFPRIFSWELTDEQDERWGQIHDHVNEFFSKLMHWEEQDGFDMRIFVIIVICFVIAVLVFLIIRALKQSRDQRTVLVDQTISHYRIEEKGRKDQSLLDRIIRRVARKPGDPVRNLVYEFERKADKSNFGRRPYESIEEWFHRLKINVKVDIYQKVRYGKMEVSEGEIRELKRQLAEIIKQKSSPQQ